jgi:lipopolysaccharide transport system ATP-binding protein
MTELAISVEGLSKRYTSGALARGQPGLREALSTAGKLLFKRVAESRRRERAESTTIWALQDVSFDVRAGEVIGIVGRNGAGKSTLLKILSRITEPTIGHAIVRGRVASLLEVGTGFNGELTGRENVFLNGAILGMGRNETKRKFDEIVAFAEVERFVDTPVKHYSSGMYMRLAFAVAAHLDPEILIVDEVLAVGDMAFQKKCLGRMKDVAGEGRTILFVSHNMGVISRLCTTGVLLQSGRIAFLGDVPTLCTRYAGEGDENRTTWRSQDMSESAKARFLEIDLRDSQGELLPSPNSADPVTVRVVYELPRRTPNATLAIAILDQQMMPLFSTSPIDGGLSTLEEPGRYEASVTFPCPIFMEQIYYVTASLYSPWEQFDSLPAVLRFSVVGGLSLTSNLPGGRIGSLQLSCAWQHQRVVNEAGRKMVAQREGGYAS